MKGEKKSPNTQTNPCVLVGTYRSANAEWIEERSLYNWRLKAGCDPSQFARFTHVVLYCGDRAPIARKCEFARVVDSVWMGENGYRVSEKTTLRAGGTRRPLQAELAYLNKLGLVNSYGNKIDFRIGVGLSIDWPKVQNSILFFNNLRLKGLSDD